ncbi:MAG: ammonium transporter, partial [Pontixanthobacter sp.]
RTGWPQKLMLPHAPSLTMVGAGLLWVGWFGFNGGSAFTASADAAAAIINTHVAASVAALTWLLVERFTVGKATSVGWATGAIAGLATVTPAAGLIAPGAAMLLGVMGAVICYGAIQIITKKFKIDDSLDVFAVHGVGGIIGSLMVALLVSDSFGGAGYAEGMNFGSQLTAQLLAVGVVALWSAIATIVLAKLVAIVIPMRVTTDEEREGLDITSHGERAWELD